MQRNGLDIGKGDVLESVGKFCSLRDMLNATSGADSVVVAMCLEEFQRVVSHLDFQRSVAQTETYILWVLCPKLHDVWK